MPRQPQMHRSRSTNRKSEDCVEFYFCRISCALPAAPWNEREREGGFGKTGGRRSEGGPRPLKSKQGCRAPHASERTAFCAVSVRPTVLQSPTDRMVDRPPSASFRSTASVFNLQGNTLPLTRLGRCRVSEWIGAAQLNLEIHNSEREGDRLPRPPRPGPSTVAQRLVYSEKWPD